MYAHVTKVRPSSIGVTAVFLALAFAAFLLQPATAGAASTYTLQNVTLADGGTASGTVSVNSTFPYTIVGYDIKVTDPAFPGQPFFVNPLTSTSGMIAAGPTFAEFQVYQPNPGAYDLALSFYFPDSLFTAPLPTSLDLVALAAGGGFP